MIRITGEGHSTNHKHELIIDLNSDLSITHKDGVTEVYSDRGFLKIKTRTFKHEFVELSECEHCHKYYPKEEEVIILATDGYDCEPKAVHGSEFCGAKKN